MKQKIAVYIASPYGIGDKVQNVKNSLQVADQLLGLGFLPFCPLLSHYWHALSYKSWATWIEIDKQWVLRCDALLRLPGESRGADIEWAFALENGIPAFLDIDDLITWGKEQNHCSTEWENYNPWKDENRITGEPDGTTSK